METKKLQTRDQQRKEDCWAIEDLYREEGQWEEEFARVGALARGLKERQGTLGNSPEQLAQVLEERDQVQKLLEYYMGKNTRERQNFIIDNLVIEEDIPEEDSEPLE